MIETCVKKRVYIAPGVMAAGKLDEKHAAFWNLDLAELHCGVLPFHALYHAHKKCDCKDRIELLTLSAKAR